MRDFVASWKLLICKFYSECFLKNCSQISTPEPLKLQWHHRFVPALLIYILTQLTILYERACFSSTCIPHHDIHIFFKAGCMDEQ